MRLISAAFLLLFATYSPAATFVVTNTESGGPGSLAQAIIDANALPGADEIHFAIGSGRQTILVPYFEYITDPLTIDGTTQPGYAGEPLIEIRSSAYGVYSAFRIDAPNCTIRGLWIPHFGHIALFQLRGGNTLIEDCIIGNIPASTHTGGIWIDDSPGNVIRRCTVYDGVDANDFSIFVIGANAVGNLIVDSVVGAIDIRVQARDTVVQSTEVTGIRLGDSSGNLIGGRDPSQGNRFVGTPRAVVARVVVEGTPSSNVIVGNSFEPAVPEVVLGEGRPNDIGDADVGPNGFQNVPVIESAELVGDAPTVRFSVDSSAVASTRSLLVEFFAATGGRATEFLDSRCFEGNSIQSSTVTLPPGSIPPGGQVSASATSYADTACGTASDGTSQFATSAVCAPPVFTLHPQSATITDPPVLLTAEANAGATPVEYQWYSGESAYVGLPIAGANDPWWNASPMFTTFYWVVATTPCGEATSEAAEITVCYKPKIELLPSAHRLPVGSTLALSPNVLGGSTPLTFQWFHGSAPMQGTAIAGATGTTLQVTVGEAPKFYWVRASNGCGDAFSTAVEVVPCAPPVITEQPVSVTVTSGSEARLTVGVRGDAPLAYQWFEGNSGDLSKRIPGATTSELRVKAAATSLYWVLVSNDCGGVESAAAQVTVESARRRLVRRSTTPGPLKGPVAP